ncbi:MAG: pyruvate kinase [Chloroflexota bacterium]|nr:MAG: pyruvate kinase [Chloroflexota bacterium]
MGLPTKKTKIVCTIGPATWEVATLEKLIGAGMDIARINLAHGDRNSHRKAIANIRTAAENLEERVAIFADLPGPKIRIGQIKEGIHLDQGQSFILQTEDVLGDQEKASTEFEHLPDAVKPGDKIYMNDGYIQLTVDQVKGDQVQCTVNVGGELRTNVGINFPGIDLGISAFTEHDRDLLEFAAEQNLDGVGESFVQSREDILAVREAAASMNYSPFIIAKIERANALKNIASILEETDVIMVARGDLGVEIPIEKIPTAQKQLIRQANLVGKPVITATQMLESMILNRRPTRSEATDVANAIQDGTDCVMLSGETAIGGYPVDAVLTMANLIQEAESGLEFRGIADLLKMKQKREEISTQDLVSLAVYFTIETIQPALVIILAKSGATARRVSRFGLPQWIIAPSHAEVTCQQLQFSRGIFPVLVLEEGALDSPEARRNYACDMLAQLGVDRGLVVLLEGSGTLKAEDTKRIDIINLD